MPELAVVGRELVGQIREYLKKTDLADGLLLFVQEESDPYVAQITGMKSIVPTAIYIPKYGPSVGITADWESNSLRRTGVLDEVREYSYYTKNWRKCLKGMINPLIKGKKKTALNFSVDEAQVDFLSHGQYKFLEKERQGFFGRLLSRFTTKENCAFVSSEPLWREAGYRKTRPGATNSPEKARQVRSKQLKEIEGLTLVGGAGKANDILLKYISGVRHAHRAALVDGILIVHESEADIVARDALDEVAVYAESTQFEKLLTDKIAKQKETLCNSDTITEGGYRLLVKTAGKKKPKPAKKDRLDRLRAAKLPEEASAIREGCSITDRLVLETFDEIKSGMTEKEIYELLLGKMEKAGVEPSFVPIVAIGKNSANIHHLLPSEEKAENGKNILMDVGIFVDGMASDKTYNGFFGEPPQEYLKAHEAVEKALLAAMSKVKAGVKGKKPDGAARRVLSKAKYPDFNHSTGHSCGFEVHDKGPKLRKDEKKLLPEGEVVTVEPGIYGKWGIRIETDVLVTRDGAELLSPVPKLMVKKL